MSRNSSSQDTWVPVLASVGLFLATTAVAQWAKAMGDQQWGNDTDDNIDRVEYIDDNDNNDANLEQLRKWYHSRRVHDRLSYENIHDSLLMPAESLDKSSSMANESFTPVVDQELTWRGTNRSSSTRPVNNTPSLSGLFDPPPVTPATATTPVGVTEWDLHCHSRNLSRQSLAIDFPSLERRDSKAATVDQQGLHPNSDYDFHPKNRNWRHFEHFNENDPRRNQPQNTSLSSSERGDVMCAHPGSRAFQEMKQESQHYNNDSSSSHPHHHHNNSNHNPDVQPTPPPKMKPSASIVVSHPRMVDSDEDEEENNDANSVSSEGSDSSEEQFVWMKHSHRPSQRKHRSKEESTESSSSWPEAFRKRVPSFLNLFMESTTIDNNNNYNKTDEEPYTPAHGGTNRASAPPPIPSPSADLPPRKTKERRPHPHIASRTQSSIDSDYRTQSKSQQDNKRKARRKSLPPNMSADRNEPEPEMPTSFPLALQRMWSRQMSSNSILSDTKPRSSDPRNVAIAPRPSPQPSLQVGPVISQQDHRQLRAQYNATIMPEKVILIRHGQSMGNINELLYSTTPDNAMPLTRLGWEQARAAGEILKQKILRRGETVHFIVSPYVRTVETFHGMVSAWCDPKEFSHIANKEKRIKAWYRRLMEMGLTWNEDSRIREQDFGNYQDPETIRKAKQERHRFGIFYYRFPHGESASDVFDRVSTFLDSLWRSFEMSKSRNYVLVTHGISIRVLLARYFRYTIDQFNILANPRNCEMVVLGHNGQGRLELQGRCALDLGPKPKTGNENGEDEKKDKDKDDVHVVGYKFHKRLRILPKQAIRKVKIRISPDD